MTMPWSLVGRLVAYLLSMLPVETAKSVIDALIDKVEAAVQGKPWEEAVMSSCQALRDILSVPDEPEEDQSNPK